MTMQTYRLKISRVNSLKLKVLSKFPAAINTGNFLKVTSENGIYTFDVDYSKLTPGPISDPATAYVAIEDKAAGIYREVSLASLLTSGLDADLQAIAALTGTGVLVRTADDTWSVRTITGTANQITVTNGDGVAGNPTVSLPTVLKAPGSLEVVGTDLKMTGGGQTPLQGTANGMYLNPNLTLVQATVETVGGIEGGYFGHDPSTSFYMGTWSSHPLILRTGNTARVTISTAGAVQFNNYGAGTIFSDASGNLTAKNPADTRTALGLVIGTDVQAFDADLSAVAALTGTGITRRTGSNTWSVGTAVANSELATAADGTIKSNISGGTAAPSDNTITAVLDKLFGTTQGSVIYRGSSTWGALTPGTSGNFLKTQGAAANPIWAAVPGGGDLLSTNNLSDVANKATSRTNLGAFGKVVVQKFTAGGTYTPTANLIYATIECVGGGGGGGGVSGSGTSSSAGGGGGGGAYARKIATAATIGASQTVTVGSGGSGGTAGSAGGSGNTTSVGTICVAVGGSGGAGATNGGGNSGAGGLASGSTGDVTVDGNGGTPGAGSPSVNGTGAGGSGGGSYFGGGRGGITFSGGGSAGSVNSGGGGSGGTVQAAGSNTGGAGGSGLVVITEYCSS